MQVPVVYDGAEPVDFGRPCYWKEGIAQRVLKKELRVETIEVTGLDEEEGCLDDIESSSFSFTCVRQSLGARKVQEDRFMCKELLEDISYISILRGLLTVMVGRRLPTIFANICTSISPTRCVGDIIFLRIYEIF